MADTTAASTATAASTTTAAPAAAGAAAPAADKKKKRTRRTRALCIAHVRKYISHTHRLTKEPHVSEAMLYYLNLFAEQVLDAVIAQLKKIRGRRRSAIVKHVLTHAMKASGHTDTYSAFMEKAGAFYKTMGRYTRAVCNSDSEARKSLRDEYERVALTVNKYVRTRLDNADVPVTGSAHVYILTFLNTAIAVAIDNTVAVAAARLGKTTRKNTSGEIVPAGVELQSSDFEFGVQGRNAKGEHTRAIGPPVNWLRAL